MRKPVTAAALRREHATSLSGARLFHGLEEEEAKTICHRAHRTKVARGGFFFQQGDAADKMYLVVEGRVKVVQTAASGDDVLLRFCGPGTCLGLLGVVDRITHQTSAQALENCLALGWDGPDMHVLMRGHPRLASNVLSLYADSILELQARLSEAFTKLVPQRLALNLLRLVAEASKEIDSALSISLSLSRQDLAEMTGTTLYTVSRLLNLWSRYGLVAVGRKRVVIRSVDRLAAIANEEVRHP